jgi:hypothetical protein
MPYELSLAPDLDRGGHRYRAALSGSLEPAAVLELSEWLSDAKQNPDASFLIDLSHTTDTSRRARTELRALLRRHGDLRKDRRLSVLAAPKARRRTLASASVSVSAAPLLERAMSAPLPF